MAHRTLSETLDLVSVEKTSASTGHGQGRVFRALADVVRELGNRPLDASDVGAFKAASDEALNEELARRSERVGELQKTASTVGDAARVLAEGVRLAGVQDRISRREKVAKAIRARQALILLRESR